MHLISISSLHIIYSYFYALPNWACETLAPTWNSYILLWALLLLTGSTNHSPCPAVMPSPQKRKRKHLANRKFPRKQIPWPPTYAWRCGSSPWWDYKYNSVLWNEECLRNNKRGSLALKKRSKSVVVDVESGRRKSVKRLLQEYGRENVKDIYIAD